MEFWSSDHLRTVLAGQWAVRPKSALTVLGLTTDSRKPAIGKAFLALKGERTDGHEFLADAARSGVALLIVDRPEPPVGGWPSGVAVLKVGNTAAALLRLAGAYRRQLEGTKVIAVAGSNGKTTTVRLIDGVLSASRRGTASIKSFNNAVGVPLTILAAKPTDQFLICEAGTNAAGELEQLAQVIEPDIGVITSIGREHLEGFGDLSGVLREESSLFKYLRNGGIAVLCADAPGLVDAVKSFAGRLLGGIITFGFHKDADVRIAKFESGFEGVRFTLHDRSVFFVPLMGRHNASNAAAAIAVGRRLGLANEEIEAALGKTRGPEMRLERREIAGVRFLNDAYNANPESMLAAAEVLDSVSRELKPTRRVVVLGDMLELGEASPASHAEVARAFGGSAPDLAIVVGPRFTAEAAAFSTSTRVVALPDLADGRDATAAAMLAAGDLVLLKGSRGIGLERVIKAFEAPK
ncbi:MAG: UDP-N-acetylmuramoyl-tripeptide--D-alanyl-D-alanine ligase [Phycisphaerales bacterium]